MFNRAHESAQLFKRVGSSTALAMPHGWPLVERSHWMPASPPPDSAPPPTTKLQLLKSAGASVYFAVVFLWKGYMLPATRLRRRSIVGGILILFLLIILNTLHIVHWPVNARYVIAYPRLFRNRPLYIYDIASPPINYGMVPECSPLSSLGVVGAQLRRAAPFRGAMTLRS
jgi:hypothetical protein